MSSWTHGGLPTSNNGSFLSSHSSASSPSAARNLAQANENKRGSIIIRNPAERVISPPSSRRASPLSSSASSLPSFSPFSLAAAAEEEDDRQKQLGGAVSSSSANSVLTRIRQGVEQQTGSLSSSPSATSMLLGAPSLLLLNIYCPDRDVGIRLLFTPCSTVEEALDQAVRRLFASAPPSGSSSSSPSADQLEEAMKKPWRFLCLASGSNEGGSPYFLYRDRLLASYNLRDEDELDLVLPDKPPQLAKITLRDNHSTFTQRVEEDTTVWEAVHKITHKITDLAQYPLDEYALFTTDGKCLKEEELLAPYAPTMATKLEFRRMALPLKDGNQTQLRVVNRCDAASTSSSSSSSLKAAGEATPSEAPSELVLSFNRAARGWDVLRRALKLFPIKDRFSATLYLPTTEQWLPLDHTLDNLRLEENETVELRPLYKSFTLALPFGKEPHKDIYKFRAQDTLQSLYDLMLFNNPLVSESREKYTLHNKALLDLAADRPIWSYGGSFELRIKLQPVAIQLMGRQEVIDVDFSMPVEKLLQIICRRFRIDESEKDQLTLHSPASPVPLNPRSSLSEQNVPPSCALIVKTKPSSLSSASSSSGPASSPSGPTLSQPPQPPQKPATDGKILAKAAAAALAAKRAAVGGGKNPGVTITTTPALPSGTSVDDEGKITVGTIKISLDQLPSTLSIGKEDTGSYGENVNLWAEPDGPQYAVKDTGPDGNSLIHAGTLNKLVVHLTSADNTDVRFLHAFLMTYLSFTNPRTLLNKIIERYNVPADTHSDAERKRIQLKVCNVLKHWVAQHFDDFDHDLIQTVVSFVDERLAVDGHDSITSVLRNAIIKRTCGLKSRVTRARNPTSAVPLARGAAPAPKLDLRNDKWRRTMALVGGVEVPPDVALSIFDFDEEEVARQLTIREFLFYRQIKSSELLNQAWNKPKLHYKAHNVLHIIQKFNETSLWVASLILEPPKAKYRAKRWEALIKMADYIEKMNNYNTLMALVSGMNNACVSRLKWTKALMPRKSLETLERLETLMSPEGSYKSYRETIATVNPPCVPFIAVHLSDLVFIEDGNPDDINGLINWDKRALVYKVIDLVGQYQNSAYNLAYVGSVARFLDDSTSTATEKELFELSLQREPRDAQKSQIL